MVVDLCYAQFVHSAVHNTLFTLLLQARSAAAKLMYSGAGSPGRLAHGGLHKLQDLCRELGAQARGHNLLPLPFLPRPPGVPPLVFPLFPAWRPVVRATRHETSLLRLQPPGLIRFHAAAAAMGISPPPRLTSPMPPPGSFCIIVKIAGGRSGEDAAHADEGSGAQSAKL